MSDSTSEKMPNTATEVQTAIARIFDEARDRALALVASQRALPTAASEPDWISRGEAAAIRRCSLETMTTYIKEFGLGTKTATGPWRVDKCRLQSWMEGKSYQPLPSTPLDGESARENPQEDDRVS